MEGAKSVQALTNKLLSGETHVKDIPALVGVQDPHEKVFIVSGNRCLLALEAFADKLQEAGRDPAPHPSLPAVWKPLLGEDVGRRAAALVGTFGGDDQHGASSQWYHCFCSLT